MGREAGDQGIPELGSARRREGDQREIVTQT